MIKTTDSLEELFQASYHLRYYFPEEFSRIGEEKSYKFLLEKLKSTDAKERDNAASCLRFFPNKDRNTQLIEAYKRESVEDVKLGLLFAVANTNESLEVVTFLTEILSGKDGTVRWSAARSLSIIGSPESDQVLARFREDGDKEVRSQVKAHFEEKEREVEISPEEATALFEIATKLIEADAADRVVPNNALPTTVGNRAVKEVRIYQKVVIIRLRDPDGGIIINPSKASDAPAMNNYWITPTSVLGLFSFKIAE